MDKNRFSQSELQELEALEIRGGTGASDEVPQNGCSNYYMYCGADRPQNGCTNYAIACGGSLPPVQGNC